MSTPEMRVAFRDAGPFFFLLVMFSLRVTASFCGSLKQSVEVSRQSSRYTEPDNEVVRFLEA